MGTLCQPSPWPTIVGLNRAWHLQQIENTGEKEALGWLTIIYGERYQLGLSSSQNLSLGNSTPLTTALNPMDSFWPKYVLVWCSHPALSIQDIRLADIPLQGILVLESNDVILMAKAVHTLDCVPYYSFLRCRWQGFNSQQEQTHMNKRG